MAGLLSPRALSCLLAAAIASPGALAHSTDEVRGLRDAWSLSAWVLAPLLGFALAYLAGVLRLWHRARGPRGVGRGAVLAFALAMLALGLATVWPLDALGEWSLAAHMAQHLLLLCVVPPLLLAARPGAVFAHLWPAAAALLAPRLRRVGGLLSALAAATAVHSAVMWGWHWPGALAAALSHEAVHWLMHGSFLVAGLWFWATVFHRLREPTAGIAPALVALVLVMMQMGLMGALLTFAARPLYPHYAAHAPVLGLDAVADQQMAGLLMWVPACLPYLLAAVWLLRQALQRDAGRPAPPG